MLFYVKHKCRYLYNRLIGNRFHNIYHELYQIKINLLSRFIIVKVEDEPCAVYLCVTVIGYNS